MHRVTDPLELAQLQAAGKGFILNARGDPNKLHKAGCQSVGAMAAFSYRKFFFETYEEAQTWLNLNVEFSEAGWEPCGRCGPSD